MRDLIERHSDASGGNRRDFHNGAYAAIADELNAALAELEACKLELKQAQGNYKNLLNNVGQGKAKNELRKRENERLKEDNAYYRRQVDSVANAVLAIGGTWAMDGNGDVRIAPPDVEDVARRNVELANELESTKALLEELREKLGRAIGLADEIRKLQDLGGGDE